MKWKRTLIFAILLSIVPFVTVTACGPDFSPDVFVRRLRPDRPAEFAAGQLGLLLPTFPRADLIVAYRYLKGGTLDATERKAYQPTYTDSETETDQQWKEREKEDHEAEAPLKKWKELRAHSKVVPIEAGTDMRLRSIGPEFSYEYENCNRDAFRVALGTYEKRSAVWGEKSAELRDWLKGQDTVFANCPGGGLSLPDPAPASGPTLLKADRAYQIAAAHFYAGDFDEARKEFETIHRDPASPWRGLAGYVAARCLVRQAFLSVSNADGEAASFDHKLMVQAAETLKALQKEDLAYAPKTAIQNWLNLVRIRTEPGARANELSVALSGPKPDPDFAQHLQDLIWYLNTHTDDLAIREDASIDRTVTLATEGKNSSREATPKVDAFHEAFRMVEGIRASALLVDWLLTFQSPADVARVHAIREWERSKTVPWLLAAISKAHASDVSTTALMTAASKVSDQSPAWESVTYHRARLLVESGKSKEARALLDSALSILEKSGRNSSINAFATLRMHVAADLNEFLSLVPRRVLTRTSEANFAASECQEVMGNPKRKYDCEKEIALNQFNPDAAEFFNRQAPLSVLVSAAESDKLPPQLRRSLAMMAWSRSVLLKDEAAVTRLFPLLPAKLQQQAGQGVAFRAIVTLARNPGLRPYLEDGVQRNYAYDFVESFRDNWWSDGWDKPSEPDPVAGLYRGPVTFFSPQEQKEGSQQFHRLLGIGKATLYLGPIIIEHAKSNLQDPDVPEALYLVMRMVRYSGRSWDETEAEKAARAKEQAMLREAASLLWHHYPKSVWTAKARPFGPG